MSDSVKWNSSASRALHAPTRSRWAEVECGLKLIVVGYLVLVLLAVPGAVCWALSQGSPLLPALGPDGRDNAELLAIVLGLGGAMAGYLLCLLGQWRCLVYASQDHGAKELLFVCVLATLVAAPPAVAAPFLDGPWDRHALTRLLSAVEKLKAPAIGSVLQVVAVVLAFVSMMALSQFAKTVAVRFEDGLLARNVSAFSLYVCLLLGGSAGACFAFQQSTSSAAWFPACAAGLAAGWAACLAWHAMLIVVAWRRVRRAMAKLIAALSPQDKGQAKPYSGVHRVFHVRVE
jgi:hypothetical protein